MRKIVFAICIVLFLTPLIGQVSLDFTIHTLSNSTSITCNNNSVKYTVRSNSSDSIHYTWVGFQASYSGATVNITAPGNYSVYAARPNGESQTKLLTVGIDLVYPSSAIQPTNQIINCNNASLAQVTALSTGFGSNLSHHFLSPYGGSFVSNTSVTAYIPSVPGTYTHVLINTDNGCSTTKTFVVNSSSGFPTFNVSSLSNFSLGCGTNSVTTISIDNAVTTPISGGAVSYTILGPQTSTNVVAGNLSTNHNYTLNVPGNYTLITRDNSSSCETRVPVSVIQNTLAPDLSVLIPTQILDCTKSQVKLEALSFTNGVTFHWLWQGNPGAPLFTSSISVNSNSQTLNPVVNIYTLVARSQYNQCVTNSVIPIYQNLFKPKPVIVAQTNKLTCANPLVILTNQSSSTIPPSTVLTNSLPVSAYWKSPLAQNSVLSTIYTASTSGYYKLEAVDQNNGCKSSTLFPIFDHKVYPMVNNPVVPAPFCINTVSTSVYVYPIITQDTKNFSYQWTGPSSASLSVANSYSYSANALGIYTVVVTNTTNGCSTMAQVIVANCYTGISENTFANANISVYPNPSTGVFTLDNRGYAKNISVKIYNALGMYLNEQSVLFGTNTIDLSNYPTGIYTLLLMEENRLKASIKLIKD